MNIIDIALGVLLAEAVLWSIRTAVTYVVMRRAKHEMALAKLANARLAAKDIQDAEFNRTFSSYPGTHRN